MRKPFSYLRGDYAGSAALIAAIVPFLILSYYNHPQNDDYVYAARADAFGFVGASVWWFNIWTGRYVATAILSMSPLVFRSFLAYKFVAASIILLLGASLFALVRELTHSFLSRRQQSLLALTVLALYLWQMPSIPEGLYWMAGAVTYQLGCILLLFLAALFIRIDRQPKRGVIPHVLAIILITAISGTNELAMLLLLELSVLMLVADFVLNRRLSLWKSAVAGVSILTSAIATFAPGAQARYALSPHDLSLSVQSAFMVGGRYLGHWLLTTPILPATALLAPLLARVPRSISTGLCHPLITFPLFLITYFALYFPSFYGTGIIEPRTVTVIYLFFLVGFLMNAFILAGYFLERLGKPAAPLPRTLAAAAMVLVIAQFIFFDSNVKAAWSDLLTGTAARYSRELDERYAAIDACWLPVCEVEPLRNKPKVIYYFENALDEKTDNEFFHRYKDNGYAAYFHKLRIRLKSGV